MTRGLCKWLRRWNFNGNTMNCKLIRVKKKLSVEQIQIVKLMWRLSSNRPCFAQRKPFQWVYNYIVSNFIISNNKQKHKNYILQQLHTQNIGKFSGPRQVKHEQRCPPWMEVGMWMFIINKQINLHFLFCLGICCSHYFKHLDNVQKKSSLTYFCDLVCWSLTSVIHRFQVR